MNRPTLLLAGRARPLKQKACPDPGKINFTSSSARHEEAGHVRSFLGVSEQNPRVRVETAHYGYVLEIGRVVMKILCDRFMHSKDIPRSFLSCGPIGRAPSGERRLEEEEKLGVEKEVGFKCGFPVPGKKKKTRSQEKTRPIRAAYPSVREETSMARASGSDGRRYHREGAFCSAVENPRRCARDPREKVWHLAADQFGGSGFRSSKGLAYGFLHATGFSPPGDRRPRSIGPNAVARMGFRPDMGILCRRRRSSASIRPSFPPRARLNISSTTPAK